MMRRGIFSLLFLLGILAAGASRAQTSEAPPDIVTNWEDLLPPGLYDFMPKTLMSYEDYMKPEFQEKLIAADRKIRPVLDSKPIILPGYMVPLEYKGTDVYVFLLVPSAGQCIHVPPPPVNQTVYVALEKPTRMRTYGEPVIVEGIVRTKGAVTEYAETGYRINASEVIDFDIDVLEERIINAGGE